MTLRFVEEIQRLIDQTPEHVVGSVEVDQVYAHYQHEHPEFHHPDGGGAFYLRDPLFEQCGSYLEHIARNFLSHDGVHVTRPMADNMEHLSQEIYVRAPFEFGDLKASGHPTVTEDGTVTYDRPPLAPRLDKEELRIKNHLRYLFDPHRYDRPL